MNRKTKNILIVMLVLGVVCGVCCRAEAFWIWSSETGKWSNPKYDPEKGHPEEQLAFIEGLFNKGNYQESLVQAKRLLAYYPESKEAPEAQYYMGRVYEKTSKLYVAYQAYQKVIDKYPYNERFKEILQRELDIGQKFLEGRKRKIWKVSVSFMVEDPAVEIFIKVVENAPYGEYAPVSQYKLGLAYKRIGLFEEARDAFQDLIEKYPDSEWIDAANYQLAEVALGGSLPSDYDQQMTEEAVRKFEEFVKEHPDAKLSEKAREEIGDLRKREAKKQYDTARFYETRKEYTSACIYYEYLINEFPQTEWAEKGKKRLERIKDKCE